MQNKPYQIAFIGGGINSAVGETHKIASQMDGCFQLVAGSFSSHAKTNEETAIAWNVPKERLYENYLTLLEKEKGCLDAVVILAPTDHHKEIVIQALQHGYPVICEKSLATSYEDGLEIKKVVEETHGFFCITYNYTGYPMIRELKRLIKDGRLGTIQQIQMEMPQEGFLRLGPNGEPPKPQAWRLHDTVIPKISLDLGSHLHNMILFLTGKNPLRIMADQTTFGLFPQIVDNVYALAQYPENMKAQIWFSKTALGQRNGLRIRVFGSKASAEWFQMDPEILRMADVYGNISLMDRTTQVQEANMARYNRFKAGHPAGFIEAFANYYRDIADCLTEYKKTGKYESPFVFGIKPSCDGLSMMQAAARSATNGQWEFVFYEPL